MYQAPYGIELAANVFGRQGYPFPLFRQGTSAALGADSGLQVLVTPTIDYFRYPNVWDTDIRAAREFINEGVLNRAILLGYLPHGSKGWDEANAAALWDYGCAKFARALPKELVMFGERA